jgi:hypothetical protein
MCFYDKLELPLSKREGKMEKENRMKLIMTCFDGKVEWHIPQRALVFASLPPNDYAKLETWIKRHDKVNFCLASHGVVVFLNDTIIERHEAKKAMD